MRKFLFYAWAALALTLLLALPASAANYRMEKLKDDSGFKSTIFDTVTASDFLFAEATGFMRLSFTKGNTFEAVVYGCDISNPTTPSSDGRCTALTTLSASTNSVELETGRQWIVIDVTTAETDPDISYITIRGHPSQASSGGGGSVVGVGTYASMTAANASAGDIWVLTDDDATGSACDAGGTPATADLPCQYYADTVSWRPFGGAITGLTNPVTAELDMGVFSVDLSGGGTVDGVDVSEINALDDETYYAADYAGADIGAQVNAAYAAAVAAGVKGMVIQLPPGDFQQVTEMDFCSEGIDEDFAVILRGHGAGMANKAGTELIADSTFESSVVSETSGYTVVVNQDHAGGDSLLRDEINCTDCDFLAAGIVRGDLIETTLFDGSGNYNRDAGTMPLKVYRVTATNLVVEDESNTNASFSTQASPDTDATVRRLKPQISMCNAAQYVEDVTIDGSASEYADIGIHFKPDNWPVDACTGTDLPFVGCSGVGTGSNPTNIMVNGGADRLDVRRQKYINIALTAPERGGQADHFRVNDSHLRESPVGFWYDSLQSQPGPVLSNTQMEAFTRNGVRIASGTGKLLHTTIISSEADCDADTYGACWHVEVLTNNTVGLDMISSNIETKAGDGIKIGNVTSQIRHLNLIGNRISSNDADATDMQLLSIAQMPGIFVNQGNTWANNAGPSNAPTLDVANSSQGTNDLYVVGRSAYRNQGSPAPVLNVASDIPTSVYEDSDATWTGAHDYTGAAVTGVGVNYDAIVDISDPTTMCANWSTAMEPWFTKVVDPSDEWNVLVTGTPSAPFDILNDAYDESGAWPYFSCFMLHPGTGTVTTSPYPDSTTQAEADTSATFNTHGKLNIHMATGEIPIDQTSLSKNACLFDFGNGYLAGREAVNAGVPTTARGPRGRLGGTVRIYGETLVTVSTTNESGHPTGTNINLGEYIPEFSSTTRLDDQSTTAFSPLCMYGATYLNAREWDFDFEQLDSDDIGIHMVSSWGASITIDSVDGGDGIGLQSYGNNNGDIQIKNLRKQDYGVVLGGGRLSDGTVSRGDYCTDDYDNVLGEAQTTGDPDNICDSDGVSEAQDDLSYFWSSCAAGAPFCTPDHTSSNIRVTGGTNEGHKYAVWVDIDGGTHQRIANQYQECLGSDCATSGMLFRPDLCDGTTGTDPVLRGTPITECVDTDESGLCDADETTTLLNSEDILCATSSGQALSIDEPPSWSIIGIEDSRLLAVALDDVPSIWLGPGYSDHFTMSISGGQSTPEMGDASAGEDARAPFKASSELDCTTGVGCGTVTMGATTKTTQAATGAVANVPHVDYGGFFRVHPLGIYAKNTRLQIYGDADCSDNSLVNELCVDTNDQTFWVEGSQITGGGGSGATTAGSAVTYPTDNNDDFGIGWDTAGELNSNFSIFLDDGFGRIDFAGGGSDPGILSTTGMQVTAAALLELQATDIEVETGDAGDITINAGASNDVIVTSTNFNVSAAGDVAIDGALSLGTREVFDDAVDEDTPDVSGGSYFKTDTETRTIIDFDAGAGSLVAGQIISVESGGPTTYACPSSAHFRCGTTSLATEAGDLTTWIYDVEGDWHLISWLDNNADMTPGAGVGGTTAATSETYVTDATDDFAIGAADSTAEFFFDVDPGIFYMNGTDPSINSSNTELSIDTGTADLVINSTNWEVTDVGAATFASVTTTPSDSAELRFTSDVDAVETAIGIIEENTDDSTLEFTVDDSTGSNQVYMEINGATETILMNKPLQAPVARASSTGGALAINTITLATAAGDYDLGDDCDAGDEGNFATVLVRDVSETVSLTVTGTEDTINYKGLSLGANYELDSPGAALDSVTVVCLEANEWYATSNSGDWTDGGVAD